MDPLKLFCQLTLHMIMDSIYWKFKAIQEEQRTRGHGLDKKQTQLTPAKSKIEGMLENIQKQLDELVESRCHNSQTIEMMKTYVKKCASNHGEGKPMWIIKMKRYIAQERFGRNDKANTD
ncbi:hypothetical protein PVK06_005339 [Gossypium arboreum]|uniref:Uncharacterized protein n=1 Tax=Gossypium arboreum TaxID=29729 RepID=A0ABR0QUC3_GOSAR|nr:hypothetical protein PVK06_005339 [Gossypium arboreum]